MLGSIGFVDLGNVGAFEPRPARRAEWAEYYGVEDMAKGSQP